MDSSQTNKKVVSVLVVAVFALATLLGAAVYIGNNLATPLGYNGTVTYHANNGTGNQLAVTYDGLVLSEYNPQYWAGTVDGADGEVNWTGPASNASGNVTVICTLPTMSKSTTYTLNCSLPSGVTITNATLSGATVTTGAGVIKITTGNGTISKDLYVFLSYSSASGSATKVFAGWATTSDGSAAYDPGELVSGQTDLYACWVNPDFYFSASSSQQWNNKVATMTLSVSPTIPVASLSGIVSMASSTQILRSQGQASMYSTIYSLSSNCTVSSDLTLTGVVGTIRSADTSSSSNFKTIDLSDYDVTLGGNLVIDNVKLSGYRTSDNNHGDGPTGSIFANGKVLILGTNIVTVASTTDSSGMYTQKSYPQIFGGNNAGSAVSSTEVIIHSGVYQNVIAGSLKASVTNDTELLIKHSTVLDTLAGGNGGGIDTAGTIGGSTYVYATGLIMPGDSYEESSLRGGSVPVNVIPANTFLNESTIFTGGSNSTTIGGSTHVYLSGNSEVWDIQAAGRRSPSVISGNVNMEISGNALVKHVACGSITDGNVRGDAQCLQNSNITIKGNARVAAVYGAGFDAFYEPKYVSMYGTTITVNMEGGTVGYIYGGGYRGTVGTAEHPMTIVINMTGGTVLNDVFGGGRGGVDKICHKLSGALDWGSAYDDSTGYSITYGKVSINLTGGTVNGNVYGGGESVPMLSSYTGITNKTFKSNYEGVAQVIGDVSINVSNCAIGGNIYGAGKGVDLTKTDNSVSYAMDTSGKIVTIDWTNGGTATYLSSDNYSEYAKVIGKISISIASGSVTNVYGGGQIAAVANGTGTAAMIGISGGTVNGNVYGGGAYGAMTGNTAVAISGGTVGGSVYGGGEGSNVSGKYAKVTGSTSVIVSNGTIAGSVYGAGCGVLNTPEAAYVSGTSAVSISGGAIAGNVYGGSAYGMVGGNVSATISGGTVGGSVYGGGLGYTGLTSTTGTRTVTVSGGKSGEASTVPAGSAMTVHQ
jgi:hypothetical protein